MAIDQIIQSLTQASLLVQIVMLLLLLISIYSWLLIISHSFMIGRARRAALRFEKHFWQGRDLNNLYQQINAYQHQAQGMETLFETGYTTFIRLQKAKKDIAHTDIVSSVQRAMQARLLRESGQLEARLPTLATIGSVSPYIGLFGTVFGIINAFYALGNVEQATLAMVAPGISEALIATAMGLFAAIPAVMAYNNYINQVDQILNHYDIFIDEFTALLQRHAIQRHSKADIAPES